MKHLVIKSVCFFVTILFTNYVFAENNIKANLCSAFIHQNKTHAMFLDENGNQVNAALDLGKLDIDKMQGEILLSQRKFHLIVFPKQLTNVEGDISGGQVDIKKTKPQCASTNEYILSIGILPYNYNVGLIEDAVIGITLSNPNEDGDTENIEKKITGTLFRPQIDIAEAGKPVRVMLGLFKSENSTEIKLVNSGNKPFQFGKWVKNYDNQAQDLSFKENSCSKIQLKPLETCSIYITKTNYKKLNGKVYGWENTAGVKIFVESSSDGVRAYTENQ